MHLLFKLAVLLTLLFAACIGLIRAQPYDDSELRAFLTPPEGCPMPCFMGIRPGVTTADEALAILEAHEWVGEVEMDGFEDRSGFIGWSWSGLQPEFINNGESGSLVISGDLVSRIGLKMLTTFGKFLLWDQPDKGGLYCGGQSAGTVWYISGLFAYYQESFAITANVPPTYCPSIDVHCSLSIQDFWSSPSRLIFGENYLSRIDMETLANNLGCDYHRLE